MFICCNKPSSFSTRNLFISSSFKILNVTLPILELISKNILNNYDGITSTLFTENSHSQIFDIIDMGVNLSRGAGIFAAYSFFDWNLRW